MWELKIFYSKQLSQFCDKTIRFQNDISYQSRWLDTGWLIVWSSLDSVYRWGWCFRWKNSTMVWEIKKLLSYHENCSRAFWKLTLVFDSLDLSLVVWFLKRALVNIQDSWNFLIHHTIGVTESRNALEGTSVKTNGIALDIAAYQ